MPILKEQIGQKITGKLLRKEDELKGTDDVPRAKDLPIFPKE